jgi:hypothetical protein
MVGGYNYFGRRASATTYVRNIPPHRYLRIRVNLHAVASWDNEEMRIDVDGRRIFNQRF